MTVLQKRDPGFNARRLMGALAAAVFASAIAAGVVMAVTNEAPAPAPAAVTQSDAGAASAATSAPFVAGSAAQTHTGRVSPIAVQESDATAPFLAGSPQQTHTGRSR